MELTDIPARVWDFIENHIDTVPQLEALLLIYGRDRDGSWTVAEIATRIYVGTAPAHAILETLRRRGLIVVEGETATYRRKSTPEQVALIECVSDAYRRNLVPLATFIHSKASAPVREFARAFEIKKDR